MAQRTYQVLKLRFRSPLHLSKGKTDDYGESDELLHADTLKSALYVCARQLQGGQAVGDTDAFFQRFRISSAFPFIGDELFFPKPSARLQPFDTADVAEERQAKQHKKIAFLGQRYFEDLITTRQRTLRLADLSADGRFISDHPSAKETVAGKEQHKVVFSSEVQQRVTIPADPAADPLPYYVDRLYFGEGAGLWFAFDGDADSYADVVAALTLLGDSGIGTDRSVGNGQFEVEKGSLTLNVPDAPTHQMLLSLWCPQQPELDESFLQQSSYGLVKRGGYIASPDKPEHLTYRKKSVYMFTEGSIFLHRPQQPLTGKVIDLRPDAPDITQHVWRDGRAFSLPITLFPAAE